MKKKILTCLVIIAGFLVLSYLTVPQVLAGKIVNQSDISGWQGMSREMMSWNDRHPEDETAWTNSMFGGMPTATIHASTKGDWTQYVYDALLTGRRPATYLFISLLGAFLMMLAFGINPVVAAAGAIAVTYCAYNFQIIQVGHNTKMQALAFLPWAVAAFVFTYRKALDGKRWIPMTLLGSAGFGLFLSFQVKANHPQITYYLALMLIAYAIVILVWLLKKKEGKSLLGRFFIASGLLLVLGFAGIATNAIKLLPTYEYTPYSMRGGSTGSQEGKGSKGLDLDYATAWSYGWQELPNLLIPNFNGGSSSGAVNIKHSKTYELLRENGQSNVKEVCRHLPLYWGPQPFTAGPMYMGAITFFLFVLGLLWYRGKEKWWIVAATVLAVFLGLGSHFMPFTRFFYNYIPLYSKFRTVSMSLVVLQFTLPVLGFLVLNGIVRDCGDWSELKKKGLIALGITGGFCLLCVLFPGIAGSFTSDADASQPQVLVDALAADRRHLLVMDALRSCLFICAAFALLLWACNPEKTNCGKRGLAALFIGILVLVDMFSVGKRYLNADDFVTPRNFSSQFNKRPVDEMILEDPDLSYRVLDLTVNVFNDSHPSYWHKNIGGYSPAKLQRYQEFIDSKLAREINGIYKSIENAATVEDAQKALPNMPGLAEMNCRYIIVGAELPPLRYRYARGNAWFDGVKGKVELTSYAPNELRYKYSCADGGRLVFSEVFYPKGWTLTTETGESLDIEVYDDILRSAVVPAGEHELVMRFAPASYAVGETVSMASSILLLVLVLASVVLNLLDRFLKHKGKSDEILDSEPLGPEVEDGV